MSYKILIIGSDKKAHGIQNRKAGRLFLEAMQRNGIHWEIHFPEGQPLPPLQDYDAVVFWSHIVHHLPTYIQAAEEIEEQAKALGVPVVNSVRNAHAPHSYFLQTWRAHGVKCAKCQHFQHFEEIDLAYPIIIRRDGVHQGKDMFWVDNPHKAKQLIEERQQDQTQENFDLAIEFMDTQDANGHYRKYRSFMIGNQIIPRHLHISHHWLVNLENSVISEEAKREAQAFFHYGDDTPSKLLAAGRASGHEIIALDYSIDRDGNHVFWEVNRHFFLDGDVSTRSSEHFLKITGLNKEEVVENDEKIIQALYELVLANIQDAKAS